MTIKHLVYVLLGSAAIVLSGCGDKQAVVGSCHTGELGDKSVICINYSDAEKMSQWRTACTTIMKGDWSPDACDTTSALGGCKAGNKVIWYYPSEKHKTVEQVQQACTRKSRVFVPGPAGERDVESN